MLSYLNVYKNIIENNCSHINMYDFEIIIIEMQQIIKDIGYLPKILEPENITDLRLVALNYLIKVNDLNIIEALTNLYHKNKNIDGLWITIKNQVCNALAINNNENFDCLVNMYNKECVEKNNPALTRAILAGLAKANTYEKLNKILNTDFMFNKIRKQDIFVIIGRLTSNKFAKNRLLEFIKTNWLTFLSEYTKDVPRIVEYVGDFVKNINEFNEFIETVKPENCSMALEQTKEKINIRSERDQRIGKELVRFYNS